VNVVRALTRRDGLRLPGGGPEHLEAKLAALPLPALLAAEVAPLRVLLEPLNDESVAADARLASVVAGDPVMTQLCTAPGIGPVTAVAFVATPDVVTRFKGAHQVEAYLGLTPCEYSSGEQQRRGRISKTGNARMRYLLVEAAWRLLRTKDPAAVGRHPLRHVARREGLPRAAARRGRGGLAVSQVARRV
jgi:transposase